MEMVKKNERSKGGFKKFLTSYGGLISVIIIVMVITSILRPVFLTGSNLMQILVNNNSIFLTGFGMTFVILAGGIDLSQGALAAFSTMTVALFISMGIPVAPAIMLAVAIGAGVGIVNGLIVSVAKVHSFVVTLGMTTILRGFAVALNGGYPIPIDMGSDFINFGNGNVAGLSNTIIICIIAFIVCWFILKKTNVGRNVYAIGGNQEAAKFSGISVVKTSVFAFGICSALTALAGVILASRMFSGLPSAAVGLETQAVTAVIIGGTSFTGGDGNIAGTVIGVILLGVLLNAMVLFGLADWLQDVIQGAIIIIAVIYDKVRRKGA